MTSEMILPIVANSNPFNHDLYHMGTKLGTNVIVMYANHPSEEMTYLIIVNVITGERMKVSI